MAGAVFEVGGDVADWSVVCDSVGEERGVVADSG